MFKSLFLFAFISFSSLSFSYELDNVKKHDNWSSGVLSNSDQTIFRSISSNIKDKNSMYYFAVDLYDNCNAVNFNILTYLNIPVELSGLLAQGNFQSKIDSNKKIDGTWFIATNDANDNIFFTMLVTDEPDRFLDEIMEGKKLSVKMVVPVGLEGRENKVYNFVFSLKGAESAIQSSFKSCFSNPHKEIPSNKEIPSDDESVRKLSINYIPSAVY